MSKFILYLIVYVCEMLISYIVFSSVSDRKYRASVIFAFGMLFFISGAVINFLCLNSIWINSIYTLLSNFLFAVLFFHIQYRVAAIYVILMAIFSAAFEFATIFAVSVITGGDVVDYGSNISLLIIQATISKTLYLISCIVLVLLSRRNKSDEKIPKSFFFFPICVVSTLVSFWYISVHEALTNTDQLLLSIISIVLLSATVLMFIVYRHSTEKEIEYIQIKNENDKLQIEKAHYAILEKQNQQLMIYAHDAKNHLAAIQNLCTDSRINEYVQKLSDQLNSYANNCHSGNNILDVIIDKYVAECNMRGIEFSYDIKLCNLNEVEDIDVVSILSNLLDNALASAEKSSKKSLSLETAHKNSYSVIVISNSCDAKPVSFGEQLLTTKEDRKLHGFGLKSVKKTLKKYNGDFCWNYNEDNCMFVLTVMIGSANQI